MCIINAAYAIFDRIVFAEIGKKDGKAPLAWERSLNKQKPFLPKNPLIQTVKTLPNYRGFFACAVLRRHNSAKVGVTDRVKAIQQLQGLLCRSQYAQDALVTRVICADSGLHRRAVADAVSSDSVSRVNGRNRLRNLDSGMV